MRPSLAGWGSPENWQFSGLREGVLGLVRYVRPEYERTQAEICGFLACLSQRLRDAVLRIVLTLVRTDDDCVLSFPPTHPLRTPSGFVRLYALVGMTPRDDAGAVGHGPIVA